MITYLIFMYSSYRIHHPGSYSSYSQAESHYHSSNLTFFLCFFLSSFSDREIRIINYFLPSSFSFSRRSLVVDSVINNTSLLRRPQILLLSSVFLIVGGACGRIGLALITVGVQFVFIRTPLFFFIFRSLPSSSLLHFLVPVVWK